MLENPIFISPERIDDSILQFRGHNVLPGSALATFYDMEPADFLQAVLNNRERFPEDFVLQIGRDEYAFTEQGIAMLAGVLPSERVAAMNIEIMRAFIRARSVSEPSPKAAATPEFIASERPQWRFSDKHAAAHGEHEIEEVERSPFVIHRSAFARPRTTRPT